MSSFSISTTINVISKGILLNLVALCALVERSLDKVIKV